MQAKSAPPGQRREYPKSEGEFNRVENAIPAIIKIQSYFKRNSACLFVQKLAKARQQQIAERRSAQKANPEQVILNEFVTQLKAKNLTPEAFFRICDKAYARRISTETFKDALLHFRLRLTSTQISRLEYIFNENMDGDISYTEYQHALEAYDVSGESHLVGQGPGGKGYVKFETVACEKIVDLLKGRNMSSAELFQLCDKDQGGSVSLEELKNMIRTLKESLMEKDLQGIQKFFSMKDTDGNGQISRAEFLTLFENASQQADVKKDKDNFRQAQDQKIKAAAAHAQIDADEFAEVVIEQADQGMFSDAIGAVKGWFGGKKKDTFADLDSVIPGYKLMSPRSKCDNAVSALIKEMSKLRVSAKSVFSMADMNGQKKATVKKLREAFVKVAPKINKDLIGDALKSFSGDDKFQVEESAFTTTLNAQFDKEVNHSVPNSKNNPAASFKSKKQRPATASAIVVPNQDASNSLIRKLDNAMLKQKLSPMDAFKQADLNNNGIITVDELRMAVKQLLPEDTFSPADIKMTMIAFDKNRNGSVDENEFIGCITNARESAPAYFNATKQQPFAMDNTISSIGKTDIMRTNEEEDLDIPMLILRVIFNNMNKTATQLKQLTDSNLNILSIYWAKDDDLRVDEQDFINQYSQETSLLTESEASAVGSALEINFHQSVQQALNMLFERLRVKVPVVDAQEITSNLSIKYDDKGMASDMSIKRLFSQIHFNSPNPNLQNQFAELYQEATGNTMGRADLTRIFGQAMFTKTLLVSAETLNSKQEGVNGLALATGVWLQDADTLYKDKNLEENWKTVVFKYMAKLYDAMDSSKSAQDMHKAMAVHTKALKKVTIRKWISFLDNNKLRVVSPQNQKCLWAARQIRTILPPFMDKEMTLAQCQSMIETELVKYRTAGAQQDLDDSFNERESMAGTQASPSTKGMKSSMRQQSIVANNNTSSVVTSSTKQVRVQQTVVQQTISNSRPGSAASTAKVTNYQSSRDNAVLRDIEVTIGCPIQKPLMAYLEQERVSARELSKAYQKENNKAITKDQMRLLFKEAGGLQNNNTDIKVGMLVQLISEEDEEKEKIKNALISISKVIADPIRDSLKKMINGHDDGISKDEFMSVFVQMLHGEIDIWALCCLFYQLDIEDTMDEIVQLETLVKVLSGIKGVAYTPPGKGRAAASPAKQQAQAQVVKKTGAASSKTQALINKAQAKVGFVVQKWIDDFAHFQAVILNGLIFDMKKAGVKASQSLEQEVTVPMNDFSVNNTSVMKVINGLFKLQKVVLNPKKIRTMLCKMRDWFNAFEGDEEEAAGQFLIKKLVEAMELNKANSELDETNVLMLRYCFHQAKAKDGTELFDVFELVMITFVLTERDGFNQIQDDRIFMNHLLDMVADINEEEDLQKMVGECLYRLEIRVHLATLIIKEEKLHKEEGQKFDITVDETWQHCRFSRLCQLIGDKINADANMKKLLINTFKNSCAGDQALTYNEFQNLFKNVLGINNVTEWMFEDFLSALDINSDAKITLKEVARLAHRSGCDLEVPIEQKTGPKKNKKLVPGPDEYEIDPAKDYFRGVDTILNSEIAALKKAIILSAEVEASGEPFFDNDFGPQSVDDIRGSALSMYCQEKPPQSHPDPNNVEWLRPSEYLDEGLVGKFVKGDASANEVKQGALGDCWFIGALSVLATRDELLRGSVESIAPELVNLIDSDIAGMLSTGVFPPIFHKFRTKGIYVLRFFKDSFWRYVIIDDRLPTYKGNKQLVFGKCSQPDELWVPLIEKAYAKIHGCYQTLISGFIDDGLADLTAMVCEKRQIHNRHGEFDQDKEKFWDYLITQKENGCLMGCSVTGGTEHSIRIDGEDTGIMSGHAYSLNDCFELADPEREEERKSHRLLRIRNPWGRGEWRGKWSDDSQEMEDFETQLQAYVNDLEQDEQFAIGDTKDGTFMINYASFRDIYNRLFVVNDFPDEWSAVRFHSQWTATCSGGLPIEKTPAAMKRFAQNPQFVFRSDEDCHVFVSLQQSDGREKAQDGSYSKYPFKDRVVQTMLFMFELPDGQDRLQEYGKPAPAEKAVPKVLHEISMRVDLKAGKRYVFIPSPRKHGTLGHFHLSIYIDKSQHEYDIKRVDDPSNRYQFIMQEYDKLDRVVPAWKVKWCKENLHHMIGKDDNEQFNLSTSMVKGPGGKKLKKSKTKKMKGNKKNKMLEKMSEKMKAMVEEVEEEEDEPME